MSRWARVAGWALVIVADALGILAGLWIVQTAVRMWGAW